MKRTHAALYYDEFLIYLDSANLCWDCSPSPSCATCKAPNTVVVITRPFLLFVLTSQHTHTQIHTKNEPQNDSNMLIMCFENDQCCVHFWRTLDISRLKRWMMKVKKMFRVQNNSQAYKSRDHAIGKSLAPCSGQIIQNYYRNIVKIKKECVKAVCTQIEKCATFYF